jgi:hypothetical protein
LTIHGPSLEAFRLMDNLALVAKDRNSPEPGRLVYYGPTCPDALDFFKPRGGTPGPEAIMKTVKDVPCAELGERYRRSELYKRFVEKRKGKQPAGARGRRLPARSGPPLLLEWWALVGRLLAIKAKDTWNTALLLAQAPAIAGLVVLVYGKQLAQEPDLKHWGEVNNALGSTLFLMALAALWFGCSSSVREVVGEKAIYKRERMVGLGLGPYIASKLAVLGALCLVQCLALLGIVYLGCSLKAPPLALFGLLYLVALVGVALGLAISAVAKSEVLAIGMVPLVLLPMVILGGVMQPLHKMHKVTRVGCALAASRWAFEVLLLLESARRPHAPRPSAIPGAPAPAAEPEREMPDMAEAFFPREGHRLRPEVSAAALVVLLTVLVGAVCLVLRGQDTH